MLVGWPNTPFNPEEQLLGLLYDGGMLTREQMQILMGMSYESFRYYIRKIDRIGTRPLLRRIPLSRSYAQAPHTLAYCLSREGVRYVNGMLGIETFRIRVVPDGQMMHYIGLNDIAVRVLKKFGREGIKWLSTRESEENLTLWYNHRTGKVMKNNLTRPDATFIAAETNKKVFIKLDNDMDETAKLVEKFQAYYDLGEDTWIENDTNKPLTLWVARTDTRLDYLQRLWSSLLNTNRHGHALGIIHFLKYGKEDTWLRSYCGLERKVTF